MAKNNLFKFVLYAISDVASYIVPTGILYRLYALNHYLVLSTSSNPTSVLFVFYADIEFVATASIHD